MPNITVKIIANQTGNPPGKVADAELHFSGGPLDGLKLIGFSIWERRTGTGRNVTFPARQYSVNGERRSFALLRPTSDATAQDRIRDLILDAYAQYEAETAPRCPAVLPWAKTPCTNTANRDGGPCDECRAAVQELDETPAEAAASAVTAETLF
ncbi:MAG: hypothetical protein WBC51_03715 [Vicinamibacterales bacterium]